MKKLIHLLLGSIVIIACSKNDDSIKVEKSLTSVEMLLNNGQRISASYHYNKTSNGLEAAIVIMRIIHYRIKMENCIHLSLIQFLIAKPYIAEIPMETYLKL